MYGSEYFPIIYYSNFIQMIHSTKVFGLYSQDKMMILFKHARGKLQFCPTTMYFYSSHFLKNQFLFPGSSGC